MRWWTLGVWLGACGLISGAASAEPSLTIGAAAEADGAPVLTPWHAEHTRAAVSSTAALVVYLVEDWETRRRVLVGRWLAPTGTPLSPPFELRDGQDIGSFSVEFDGSDFVVVWYEEEHVVETSSSRFVLHSYRLEEGALGGELGTVAEQLTAQLATAAGEGKVLVLGCSNDEARDCRSWIVSEERVVSGHQLGFGSYGVPTASFSDGTWLVASATTSQTHVAQLAADGELIEGTAGVLPADAEATALSSAPATDGFALLRAIGTDAQTWHVAFDGTFSAKEAWEVDELDIREGSLLPVSDGFAWFYPSTSCQGCPWQLSAPQLSAGLSPHVPAEVVSTEEAFSVVARSSKGEAEGLVIWSDGRARAASWSSAQPDQLGLAVTVSGALTSQLEPKSAPAHDGWLVVWHELGDEVSSNAPRLRAQRLDLEGKPRRASTTLVEGLEVPHRLARGPSGWLLATSQRVVRISEDSSWGEEALPGPDWQVAGNADGWVAARVWGTDVVARRFDAQGEPDAELTVASLAAPSKYVDVTEHRGAYQIAWLDDDGDVAVAELEPGMQTPSLSRKLFTPQVTTPQRFSIAQGDGVWWAWVAGSTQRGLHTSAGSSVQLDIWSQPLVAIDGMALAALYQPDFQAPGELRVGLAEPNATMTFLHTQAISLHGYDVSQAAGGQALFTTSEPTRALGATVNRIRARLITVAGGPAGGVGGADGAAGAGGADGAAGAGEGGSGAVPMAAGAGGDVNAGGAGGDVNAGGSSSGSPSGSTAGAGSLGGNDAGSASTAEGGAAGAPVEDDGTLRARGNSKGCGCRTTGGDDSNPTVPWLPLLVGLAFARRRAGAR